MWGWCIAVGRILVDAGLVHFMHGIVVARGVLW